MEIHPLPRGDGSQTGSPLRCIISRSVALDWAGKAAPTNRVSLRDLMNLVVAPTSEGLDYLVIPALEVRGVTRTSPAARLRNFAVSAMTFSTSAGRPTKGWMTT